MELSCLQESLNRGLGIVGRAVAVKTTLPITNNILLATDQGRLKLIATNLEVAISCWLGAKVEDEGSITVNARLLTDFIHSLPNDTVALSIPKNTKTLKLKCARYEARINGVDAKEFPPIPSVDEGITTKVEVEHLRQGIKLVAFAAASRDDRPVLTGVASQFDGDILRLAGADGYRLAVHKLSITDTIEKAQVIIPARTLVELNQLIAMQEEAVEISFNTNKNQVLFRLKDIELVSQLIMGTFPDYEKLIPQTHNVRIVVNTAEFQAAVKTAYIFAREGEGVIRLVATPNSEGVQGALRVSARSEEIGDDVGEIDATVEGEGEGARIAFQGRYLNQLLGVLPQDGQVALEINNESSPCLIRPVGIDNYTHVLMPIFVQWE